MLNGDLALDWSCETALLNGHCHGAIQSVHVFIFVFITESMEISLLKTMRTKTTLIPFSCQLARVVCDEVEGQPAEVDPRQLRERQACNYHR